jgi:IS30 family transposase
LPYQGAAQLKYQTITREQKQMAHRLKAKGLMIKEIARELNLAFDTMGGTLYKKRVRLGKPDGWEPAPGRLRAEEREDILIGLTKHESISSIARRLGRAPSTVTREVAANGGAEHYGAWRAHCRARGAARRPKTPSWPIRPW